MAFKTRRRYNRIKVITIISTIIVSILFGTFSPTVFSGLNFFPTQNLFSQIASPLQQQKTLSEVDPLKSVGNVTLPLDTIWQTLKSKLEGSSLGVFNEYLSSETGKEASNLPLESRLNATDTLDSISVREVLEMAKKGLILTAQISLAVLEIAVWGLRGLLNLIT